MITLNELLDHAVVKHYTIYFDTDRGRKTRIEVPANDSDGEGMATVRRLVGEWPVKEFSPAFHGDDRMRVVIREPETPNDQEQSERRPT